MFPIQDIAPRKKFPVVTFILIVINTGIFLLEVAVPAKVLKMIIYYFGVVPARYTSNFVEFPFGLKYIDFITCMFLHGGWLHLIGNMWTLWIFGDNVEDRMGRFKFFIFYLICGITASILHIYIHPYSVTPIIGASGAISGILGAYYGLFPFSRIIVMVPVFFFPFFFEMPAILYLGWWFFIQLFSGTFSIVHRIAGGVAWWAHVGGFVAGLILYRLFCDKLKRTYKDETIFWGIIPLSNEKINR